MVNSKLSSYAPSYARRLCENVLLCAQVLRFTNNVRLQNLALFVGGNYQPPDTP